MTVVEPCKHCGAAPDTVLCWCTGAQYARCAETQTRPTTVVDVTQEDRWKTCPKGSCQRHQSCMYANCTFGSRTRPAPDGEVVELDEHFPMGLRQEYPGHIKTGEVFEHPVTCDCFCGASFVGSDEQEVRQLWAEHVSNLYAHPPRNDAVVEALEVAAQELEACAPWMGDAAKGDILRAASHCRAQIAALKQGEA